MVITRGKGAWEEVEEGKEGDISGDGGRLDWGDEHTIQYIDDVLQNCTPETYNFINQCTPIDSIKIINKIIQKINLLGH